MLYKNGPLKYIDGKKLFRQLESDLGGKCTVREALASAPDVIEKYVLQCFPV